jgi:adenylate kinase
MNQTDKIQQIKNWLGAGSINIFGLPFSGKDTVGTRLAEALGGRLLSSGDILRAQVRRQSAASIRQRNNGGITPTEDFHSIVLPFLSSAELSGLPLILSEFGRLTGEDRDVMTALEAGGHGLKAVLLLDISESEVMARFEAAKILDDRAGREDDKNQQILSRRIEEFHAKIAPVVLNYQQLGLLLQIDATGSRDEVFAAVVDKLYDLSLG